MIVKVREYSERVDLEIDGHGTAERITWPEAMERLDKAYTEDIAETAAVIDAYIKAAEAGLIQAANALDKLRGIVDILQERHVRSQIPEREEENANDTSRGCAENG